jgi:transposase
VRLVTNHVKMYRKFHYYMMRTIHFSHLFQKYLSPSFNVKQNIQNSNFSNFPWALATSSQLFARQVPIRSAWSTCIKTYAAKEIRSLLVSTAVLHQSHVLWILKPNSRQSRGCAHIHWTSRETVCQKADDNCFWAGKKCWWWNSCTKGSQWRHKHIAKYIQNKNHGMLTHGLVLLHDNARPHRAPRTRALLEHFNWELFDYPPHSPDLAPSDYHLFTYLRNWLRSHHFNNNDFFDTGIQKLIPRHKCLSSGGDCIQK